MADDKVTIDLWPDKAPGESKTLDAESDTSKPGQGLVAGKTVIRLGNVSKPQITIYRPAENIDTHAAVIICPGGGHNILAYDLEGTEVADWLTSIGVTGIVLKYRVPFRDPEDKSRAAVQDAQRAVSIVRQRAGEWKIDPAKIGILGFSAGGEVAARASLLFDKRHYDSVDKTDDVSCQPSFSVLIYPAYLTTKEKDALLPELKPSSKVHPVFLAHAFDDPVTPLSSLYLAAALRQANVQTELHMYSKGGHGYGLRHVDGVPVTDWKDPCGVWLKSIIEK